MSISRIDGGKHRLMYEELRKILAREVLPSESRKKLEEAVSYLRRSGLCLKRYPRENH